MTYWNGFFYLLASKMLRGLWKATVSYILYKILFGHVETHTLQMLTSMKFDGNCGPVHHAELIPESTESFMKQKYSKDVCVVSMLNTNSFYASSGGSLTLCSV